MSALIGNEREKVRPLSAYSSKKDVKEDALSARKSNIPPKLPSVMVSSRKLKNPLSTFITPYMRPSSAKPKPQDLSMSQRGTQSQTQNDPRLDNIQ